MWIGMRRRKRLRIAAVGYPVMAVAGGRKGHLASIPSNL